MHRILEEGIFRMSMAFQADSRELEVSGIGYGVRRKALWGF
jgi:hypothetical protein